MAAGLADALAEAGIPCFGPTAAAGRLESSKAFTKAFAERHGLPTARYGVFDDAAPAKAFLDQLHAALRDQGRRPGLRQGRGDRAGPAPRPRPRSTTRWAAASARPARGW